MLFPNLGPQYYDEKDRGILTRMENFYTDAVVPNQQFWGEAQQDTAYYSGYQDMWNDLYGNLPVQRKKQFNFNKIRRIIEMTGGFQRRNRKSIVVTPVEQGDDQTADQFTKIIMWIEQQEGILETLSDSFHGALVTGMNLLQVWMDYRRDPVSGDIRVDNCSYNSFLIDPFFRKHDLSDCNGIWKRTYLSRDQVAALLPGHEEMLGSMSGGGVGNVGFMGAGNKDGKFQYMPEAYNYSMRNLLTYDEFYYRDYRDQKILIDPSNGETMEWSGTDEKLDQYLSFYPQIAVTSNKIPTVNLAIVVQGKVMYNGRNPLNIDCYPFIPVLGYYTPEFPYLSWRVQGMVRGLRDAQYLYNRRKVIELDILESQLNSGWIAKENAFVDPKEAYKTGQGQVIWLKEEAQMADIQQIPPSQVSPSMFQLSQQLNQEIMDISGANDELLGSAVDDKAGILSMLRQGAGLTTLQKLFDQLDYSQRLLGRMLISVIQNNFTTGKLKRILAQEPTQQFYSKVFGKYDAAIEEGINTTTQRQMQFAQLLHLKQVGVPIPNETLLEAATIQNKKELMEKINQMQQQQQQQQQIQAQISMQEQQARTQLAQARAVADQGLGMERMSRIDENKALAEERRAEAAKDRDMGLLNLVKAIKEVQGIDIAHVEKLLQLSSIVKQHEEEEEIESALGELQLTNSQIAQQQLSAQQAPLQQEVPFGPSPGSMESMPSMNEQPPFMGQQGQPF